MIKVSIAGATGYTGLELLRILKNHPKVRVVGAGTESYLNKDISQVYPHLQTIYDLKGLQHDAAAMASQSDLIFTALPHGLAMQWAAVILAADKKLVDLSPDFRLQNANDYQHWYQHQPAESNLLAQAVYGLPEVGYRPQIKSAKLLANPGCYPTSCALAAFPALKAGLIETTGIIFDCKSGTSGAGRGLSLTTHFSEITENFKAYQIAGAHRHTPEIEQTLVSIAKETIRIQFTPHLVPMVRGLLTTAYFQLKQSLSAEKVWQIYQDFYQQEPFVRLRPLGDLPQTKQVSGSNYCDIGLQVDQRTGRLIVVSVIDNLVKGAAGQAVQNMNLMFDLPENMGLEQLIPIYP